jgi:hypothetical protein
VIDVSLMQPLRSDLLTAESKVDLELDDVQPGRREPRDVSSAFRDAQPNRLAASTTCRT